MNQADIKPGELAELITALTAKPEELDPGEYRYVIYARKSTDDKRNQIRSLSDQVAICQEFAKEKHLIVVGEPIQEAMSAKEPGIRPKFLQMLADIRAGKYEGIICWHPDRLARNMREGGEIIDLIDHDIIKDLKFCTGSSFEKTPNGIMMLGFTFAMSKQYSDKLSEDIARGSNRSVQEGKFHNTPKKGYYKDRNKYLRPDGINFSLLSTAWQMRLGGKSLEEIADYLNEREFSRAVGVGDVEHERVFFNTRRLSEVFRDPIYAGVMKYGENVVALCETYDFQPMVTEAEFVQLNKLGDAKNLFVGRKRVKKSSKPALLSGQVFCSSCRKPLVISITTKFLKSRTIKYLYYRCFTDKCKRRGKSTRARVVVDHAIELVQSWNMADKRVYDHYFSEAKKALSKSQEVLVAEKKALVLAMKKINANIAKAKLLMTKLKETALLNSYESDVLADIDRVKKIKSKLEKLKVKQQKLEDAIPSYEKFLELFAKLPDRLRKFKSQEQLNALLSKLYSNLYVDGVKVTNHQLKEPFAGLIKQGLIRVVDNTGLEPVTSRM